MHKILRCVLFGSPEPEPLPDIDAWWARHSTVCAAFSQPIDRAIAGGFAADRPAYAFASGYQEALRSLLGEVFADLDTSKLALTATETGGNHPRAIHTTLTEHGDDYRLSGHKTWATLGARADSYIVFASVGTDEQGRNRLAAVRVPREREGITTPAVATGTPPIVPEIPHTSVRFDNVVVRASERLPGDGYERYLKPFRTVEDVHVHAALIAWLLQVARRSDWPQSICEQFASLLLSARELGAAEPSDPVTHIALAGLIAHTHDVLGDTDELLKTVDEPTRMRWLRDRALLHIAGKARARRREVAWHKSSATPA